MDDEETFAWAGNLIIKDKYRGVNLGQILCNKMSSCLWHYRYHAKMLVTGLVTDLHHPMLQYYKKLGFDMSPEPGDERIAWAGMRFSKKEIENKIEV